MAEADLNQGQLDRSLNERDRDLSTVVRARAEDAGRNVYPT